MLVYCDVNVLIYWIDQPGPFQARAEARMQDLLAAGDRVAISELTRLECLVGPLKRGDAIFLAAFRAFFTQPEVDLVPLTAAVFDRAAQLRADLSFKLADALHLAAAIEAGCGLFLTNDLRLSRCTDIAIEVLP